ncbi:PhzF family phenazine biosynthesis isomerase [Saccharothrix sp. BKS2]|uniref:PhzF family phenazine biosynthesis protein n=1 Tax=Saccharothrix sp. BKS2 TaxID=3064400 RepID=UPI0039EB1E60
MAPATRRLRYFVVDAFTRTPLAGNPVAVFLDADDVPPREMQALAREMNLSESTFVLRPRRPDSDHRVRIFTPVNELPFAGHPLLGTAIALANNTHAGPTVALETERGVIPFELERSGGTAVAASMLQPVPTWGPYEHEEFLLRALGVDEPAVPVAAFRNGPRHVLVGTTPEHLKRVRPDQRMLAELPDMAAHCFAPSGVGWGNRMFSPAYGVVEDAATGSVAGPLAIHLALHGLAAFGEEVTIFQGVEMGRPSTMRARVTGSAARIDRVEVRGAAVQVAEGTFSLPVP